MSRSSPLVSVVTSVYNGEPYLRASVESVLRQRFSDFEFIIVDNGSQDGTASILYRYRDPRIRIVSIERNVGPASGRNRGIVVAGGDYVAFLDADDLMHPYRLEMQVAYLAKHPEVAIVGSDSYLIDEEGRTIDRQTMPSSDLEIKWSLLFLCPFIQSAMMARRVVLNEVGLFNEGDLYLSSEDYELWSRIADRYTTANLPEPLVTRLDNPIGISRSRYDLHIARGDDLAISNVQRVTGSATITREQLHAMRWLIFGHGPSPDPATAIQSAVELVHIHDAFCRRYGVSPDNSGKRGRALRSRLNLQLLDMARRCHGRDEDTDARRLLVAAWRIHGIDPPANGQIRWTLKLALGHQLTSTVQRVRSAARRSGPPQGS